MCFKISLKYLIPSGITFLRLAAAPFFYCTIISSLCVVSLGIFFFAVLTDIIDGIAARSLSAVSRFGAYADAVTDFIFITTAFTVFIQRGWYAPWVLAPTVISFSLFLLTSKNNTPVYDPLGKYIGALMMGIIACSLLFPFHAVRSLLAYCLTGSVIVHIFYRLRYIKKGD